MDKYIDLSPRHEKCSGQLQISFAYTAMDGTQIKGEKRSDWGLSEALELFACLSVDDLPPADLSKPYTLTLLSEP